MSHTRTHVQRDCVLRHVPPRATCHIGFGCIYVYLYEIFKVTTRRANSSHCDIYRPSQAGSQREEERCRVQVMTLLAAAVAAAVATEEPRVCFINMHDPSSAQLGVHTRIHRSLSLATSLSLTLSAHAYMHVYSQLDYILLSLSPGISEFLIISPVWQIAENSEENDFENFLLPSSWAAVPVTLWLRICRRGCRPQNTWNTCFHTLSRHIDKAESQSREPANLAKILPCRAPQPVLKLSLFATPAASYLSVCLSVCHPVCRSVCQPAEQILCLCLWHELPAHLHVQHTRPSKGFLFFFFWYAA